MGAHVHHDEGGTVLGLPRAWLEDRAGDITLADLGLKSVVRGYERFFGYRAQGAQRRRAQPGPGRGLPAGPEGPGTSHGRRGRARVRTTDLAGKKRGVPVLRLHKAILARREIDATAKFLHGLGADEARLEDGQERMDKPPDFHLPAPEAAQTLHISETQVKEAINTLLSWQLMRRTGPAATSCSTIPGSSSTAWPCGGSGQPGTPTGCCGPATRSRATTVASVASRMRWHGPRPGRVADRTSGAEEYLEKLDRWNMLFRSGGR